MKTRAKWLVLLTLTSLIAFGRGNPNRTEPAWRIDLKDKFDFESFDRDISFRWTMHQDVVFLSPDKVLVYQVNRSHKPVALAPRDASGGGGNFILEMRILSTVDGHEIKAIRMTTNADSTKVMATRNGRFVVRTGEILYLYSADFQRIASKPLPFQKKVAEEAWQIGVSPSGKEVTVVHQQILQRDWKSPTSDIVKASADVEIMNEENLQTISKFSLPWILTSWSSGEHVLVSSKPWPSDDGTTFGLMDYRGNWSPLLFAWYSPSQPCAYQASALDTRLFVTYGCGTLSVFPQNGRTIFSLKSPSKEYVGSVRASGNDLAVQVDRHLVRMDNAGNIPIRVAKPLRIDVYNTQNHKAVLSAPVHGERVYYALSAQGTLAVVDGTSLVLYQTGRP
ncbi:MAG TPA: hypothetical protein VFR24_26590 [Candidatus Angelobacter sp.]|nr:hypothetical protein [Candidatus Angelobacter sp.]